MILNSHYFLGLLKLLLHEIFIYAIDNITGLLSDLFEFIEPSLAVKFAFIHGKFELVTFLLDEFPDHFEANQSELYGLLASAELVKFDINSYEKAELMVEKMVSEPTIKDKFLKSFIRFQSYSRQSDEIDETSLKSCKDLLFDADIRTKNYFEGKVNGYPAYIFDFQEQNCCLTNPEHMPRPTSQLFLNCGSKDSLTQVNRNGIENFTIDVRGGFKSSERVQSIELTAKAYVGGDFYKDY